MNRFGTMRQTQAGTQVLSEFMRGVYGWMSAGLLVTAATAVYTASSQAMMQLIFGNSMLLMVLLIAEVGLVFAISGTINRLSAGTATGLFLLYSALNGVTLSAIFVIYSGAAIAKAFFTAAGMFGAMSIYGYTTKKDLSSWGSFSYNFV